MSSKEIFLIFNNQNYKDFLQLQNLLRIEKKDFIKNRSTNFLVTILMIYIGR